MSFVQTEDPDVLMEEEGVRDDGVKWVLYRSISTGRRWKVFGTCVSIGNCLIGAVMPDGTSVDTMDQAQAILTDRQSNGIKYYPVTPEFDGCCPFTYEELPNVSTLGE